MNTYPCIFGYISLSNQSSEPHFLQDVIKQLFHDNKNRCIIYQTGVSQEIHTFVDHNECIIIVGRVFFPFYLGPNRATASNTIQELTKYPLSDLSGHFVYLRVSINNDEVCIKFASDKFGSKIALYVVKNNILYFATHISGIKYLLNSQLPDIDVDSLIHYYHFGVTPNNQTLLKNVKKLPPGSLLELKNEQVTISKYFNVADLYNPDNFSDMSEEKLCIELNNRMDTAIHKRISNHEKVGIALSGGVDSGFITHKIIKNGIMPKAYNLVYPNYYDEGDRIALLSREYNLKVERLIATPEKIMDNNIKANQISSEPVAFNNATLRVLALAAKEDHLDTLFDGDGADRLFLGMNSHLKVHKSMKVYDTLKMTGLIYITLLLLRLIKSAQLNKLYVVYRNWHNGIPPYPERDYGHLNGYNDRLENDVYKLSSERHWQEFKEYFPKNERELYRIYQSIQMCPEMFFHAPSEIQIPLGLFPMPAFWDEDIVSLALSIPSYLRLKNGKTKYILRKAAAFNSSAKYWELPKIGLQNSLVFLTKSKEGKKWRDEIHQSIMNTKVYEFLKDHLFGNPVDLDRLIPLRLWMDEHQVND